MWYLKRLLCVSWLNSSGKGLKRLDSVFANAWIGVSAFWHHDNLVGTLNLVFRIYSMPYRNTRASARAPARVLGRAPGYICSNDLCLKYCETLGDWNKHVARSRTCSRTHYEPIALNLYLTQMKECELRNRATTSRKFSYALMQPITKSNGGLKRMRGASRMNRLSYPRPQSSPRTTTKPN